MEHWKERTQLLLGEENLKRLEGYTVAIIGLGGVGAYAAEMLCRAGIGNLLLLDSDVVSESNINRQLLALEATVGEKKTKVALERFRQINKNANIEIIEDYLTPENINFLLGGKKIDFLVDAIDTLAPKIALIQYCITNKIPHVSSMGAGAKIDATAVRLTDISKSFNCPLAYILRKKLRKIGISSGFDVVFSEELPDKSAIIAVEERNKKSNVGTISYLPAVFGCVCAQAAIIHLLELK